LHTLPQWSISFNHHRDTLRGLHSSLPRMKRSSSSVAREERYSTDELHMKIGFRHHVQGTPPRMQSEIKNPDLREPCLDRQEITRHTRFAAKYNHRPNDLVTMVLATVA
jgi:hypothetical protein